MTQSKIKVIGLGEGEEFPLWAENLRNAIEVRLLCDDWLGISVSSDKSEVRFTVFRKVLAPHKNIESLMYCNSYLLSQVQAELWNTYAKADYPSIIADSLLKEIEDKIALHRK